MDLRVHVAKIVEPNGHCLCGPANANELPSEDHNERAAQLLLKITNKRARNRDGKTPEVSEIFYRIKICPIVLNTSSSNAKKERS